MIPKFSSKEFHFLKPGSQAHPVQPPSVYLSDLIHSRTDAYESFSRRIAAADMPGPAFLCAAIRVGGDMDEARAERIEDVFEACFNLVLDKKRGIWEVLQPAAFVLAFWDYDTEKKARQLLDSLKENISKTLETQLMIGVTTFPFQTYSKSETFGNALKALDHAAFFGPGKQQRFNALSLNISGDRLYQLGRHDEAMAEYEKGLDLEPMNLNLINSLGVCHGVTEDLEKAKETFEQALAISSKEIMVLYNLGLIHRIKGDADKSILYLRKAHGIDDTIFEVELLLGHLLFKEKKHDQALPHLLAASRLHPASALSFRMLGEIFLEKQEPAQAGAAFNSAVKLTPHDPAVLSGYAAAMARRKRNLKIALNFAKKSVDLEPDNPLFRDRLDEVLETMDMASRDKNPSIKSA